MEARPGFAWPAGRRAAVSLTFDDARPSQLDCALPVLDSYGRKATFYVSFDHLERRLDEWGRAAGNGHEIGNHTVTHPCSGNFAFSRHNPLEDYTLERIEDELLGASARIETLLGVRPATFAYPCGQKFVGRGQRLRSYVPLVARHFVAGRGFRDEDANDPTCCDLAQLFGVDLDCLAFEDLAPLIDRTLAQGGWLVLAGHDAAPRDPARAVPQTVWRQTLEEICRRAAAPESGLWLDTVAAIGTYVCSQRSEPA